MISTFLNEKVVNERPAVWFVSSVKTVARIVLHDHNSLSENIEQT